MELNFEIDLLPLLSDFAHAENPFVDPGWPDLDELILSKAISNHAELEEMVLDFQVHQFVEAADGTWLFAGGNGDTVCVFSKPVGEDTLRLHLRLRHADVFLKSHHCAKLDFFNLDDVLIVVTEYMNEKSAKVSFLSVLQGGQLIFSDRESTLGSPDRPKPFMMTVHYDAARREIWLLSIVKQSLQRVSLGGENKEATVHNIGATAMIDLPPEYLLLGGSGGQFQVLSKLSMERLDTFILPAAGFHPPTHLLSVPGHNFVCVGAVADASDDDREDQISATHGHILWLEHDQAGRMIMKWRHDIPEYIPSVWGYLPRLRCLAHGGECSVAYIGGDSEAELRMLDSNGNMKRYPQGCSVFQPLAIHVSGLTGNIILSSGRRLRFLMPSV